MIMGLFCHILTEITKDKNKEVNFQTLQILVASKNTNNIYRITTLSGHFYELYK